MRATDWTYYQAQDEVDPTEYHPDWPTELKEMGSIMIPVGSEAIFNRSRIPPRALTYWGRTLRLKIADIKQQKSWGNLQEQLGILKRMRNTDEAIQNDPDWAVTLRRCREDPTEGYLHTVLPAGEVLPFSNAVALAYRYPCTLGKEQEGLHKRLVYSSAYGLLLITTAQSGKLRIQDQWRNALEALRQGKDHVGYVGDEVCEEDRPNPDIVTNQWSLVGSNYECHHAECVVVGTARFYFLTEEEYLTHWNAFHAAVSSWYVCPAQGCKFLVPGEPDAFDCYMMHVQRRHVAHGEAGELERESAGTSEDSTRWGINPCFRYVELGHRYPPRRKALVEVPFNEPVIGARWIAHQQMNSLHKCGFPDAKFLNHQPYWGECKPRTWGGTSYKHQREKEVRRQCKEAERRREEEVACYSPASSSSRAAEQITQAARLRLVTGMVKPPLPCGGVALSAALTYEDALVEEGKEEPKYWMYARVMAQSFCVGRSIVAYRTLPLMRSDRQPVGWDEWGRPWALMDIAKRDIPTNQEVWCHPHTKGRALVAVLVRYDEEPYYFPDAPTLLKALPRRARAEGVTEAQPGTQGWSAQKLKQVEQLLRPHTYPPCAAVSACLRKWPQFAHQGEGYREGPAMPGGPEPVIFKSEDWDHPEPIVPPVPTG